MLKPTIFVTRPIPKNGLDLLRAAKMSIDLFDGDEVIPRQELLKRVKGSSALLCLLTEHVDDELLDAAGPSLKVIANYAVGFDNIDLKAAKKRSIIVTNTPAPEVSESVAEHAFALMITLARRILEADEHVRHKQFSNWSPTFLLGTDLHSKTLGVIGLGRIGKAVAKRAVHGFNMRCLYTQRRRDEDFEQEFHAQFVSQDDLLRESNFVTLHVPLLPSTRHLISTAEFSLMKKTAFLVNTSRGPVVDEKALLRALQTKRIAGSGLDVFECEPEFDCDLSDKLELRSFPNVVLTPHVGSATIEAREAMSKLAAENIIAVLSGKPAINPVIP